MFTRRTFLKYTGGSVLTLYAFDRFGVPVALAQIPGCSLDPGVVPKFQTPLLIPPVMPKAGRIVMRGGKQVDYYEISVKQFAQQILPAGLPATIVWGYGALSANGNRGLLLHNPPARRPGGARHAPELRQHTAALHRTGAHGHPCARRSRRRRRERRLYRGLVPARCEQHSTGLRPCRHLVRFLRREGRGQIR